MKLNEAIDPVLDEASVPFGFRRAGQSDQPGATDARLDGTPVEAEQIGARVRRPTYRKRNMIDQQHRIQRARQPR
jgi:hypothetical protein